MLKKRIYMLLMYILMSCVMVSACSFSSKEETEQSSEKKSKKKRKKKKDKKKKDIDKSDIAEDEDEEEESEEESKSSKNSSSEYDELKQQIANEIEDYLTQDKVMLTITYGEGADSWMADVMRERHEGMNYYYFYPINNPDDSTRVLANEEDIYISKDYGGTWTVPDGENDYEYEAITNYLKYVNYLSFIYAAMDSGIEVKMNDGGAGRHVITVNEQEAKNLDTDLKRLGIPYEPSKFFETDMYKENERMIKSFNKGSVKSYVFGLNNGEFSILESTIEEDGRESYYTITVRVPNKDINDVEMMPLNELTENINSPNP